MHELALSESIVELVVAAARQEGIARVSRVVVEIGAAAAVDPQALLFCFPVAAASTAAAEAELVIDHIALRAKCDSCGADYAPESLISACPACGGFAHEILA